MRFASDVDESQHIVRNAPALHGRVLVLYHDYATLEGTVVATSHRRNPWEPWTHGCCFTVRTSDDCDLEIDVLEVHSVHHLDAA